MTQQQYIEEAEQTLLHTYNRYQIVFDKGEGVYLYDTDGRKYLDFVAGIAVHAFGHSNKALNEAIRSTNCYIFQITITVYRQLKQQKN